jgi:hypothetical protein
MPLAETQFCTSDILYQNFRCRLMEVASGVVMFKECNLVRMIIDVGSNEHTFFLNPCALAHYSHNHGTMYSLS